MLLLNAMPWPLQLADKFRCGVCSPLVGGIGFWARLLLLCRERSPLLWLWVWGGFELCTPLPPFLHPASQTPHSEQSWSGYRFGGGSIVQSALLKVQCLEPSDEEPLIQSNDVIHKKKRVERWESHGDGWITWLSVWSTSKGSAVSA